MIPRHSKLFLPRQAKRISQHELHDTRQRQTEAKSWIWNWLTPCISTSWGLTAWASAVLKRRWGPGVGYVNKSEAVCHMQTGGQIKEIALFSAHQIRAGIWWPVLTPQYKKDEGKLKQVWNSVTSVDSGLEHLTYEERLTEQGFFTLENRWLQGT